MSLETELKNLTEAVNSLVGVVTERGRLIDELAGIAEGKTEKKKPAAKKAVKKVEPAEAEADITIEDLRAAALAAAKVDKTASRDAVLSFGKSLSEVRYGDYAPLLSKLTKLAEAA